MAEIGTVALPCGEQVAALGQGTWKMAERGSAEEDVKALRLGIELGMTLIDTAEMYGEGKVETIVGRAIAGQRDRIFLVSKVYPHNASRRGVVEACDRSLKRLGIERLDLYLLHWRGNAALRETVAGFEDLMRAGKIRFWGVSNFDVGDMEDLFAVPGGAACATNQILYNLARRGPEFALIPWLTQRGIPVMAYSPFEQGRLPKEGALTEIGRRHQAHPYQIALAWLLRQKQVIAIPKSGQQTHLRDNRAAAAIALMDADVAALDAAFKPPKKRTAIDML